MNNYQSGILADVPLQTRYLSFSMDHDGDVKAALQQLAEFADGESTVVGIGDSVTRALNHPVTGLTSFPLFEEAQVEVPATNSDLWCWLRGDDRGELVRRTHDLVNLLVEGFICEQIIDGFRFDSGRDLTGYEDGTENPVDDEAVKVAILTHAGEGLNGSSFVAVQQWVHNLDDFLSRPQSEQDETIGRRKSDNEEIDDAPETAHVKRTAQEDFEPEAFILRRSMPWADSAHEGLVFVAFGHSFNAFSALLKRMVGADDGQLDALFSFTTPVTGSYFWCPPILNGKLDLRALGIN
jgi:putative iron-dependent peroxidase